MTTSTENRLDAQIAKLTEQRENARKRKFWSCPECGRRTKVDKIDLTVGIYYVPPSGCTDGAYWDEDGDFYIKCPKCQKMIRIFYLGSEKDKAHKWAFVQEYREYFRSRNRENGQNVKEDVQYCD